MKNKGLESRKATILSGEDSHMARRRGAVAHRRCLDQIRCLARDGLMEAIKGHNLAPDPQTRKETAYGSTVEPARS